jgi:hypothetical protein
MHVFVVMGCTQFKNVVLLAANSRIINYKWLNDRAWEYTTETALQFRHSQSTILFTELNVPTWSVFGNAHRHRIKTVGEVRGSNAVDSLLKNRSGF